MTPQLLGFIGGWLGLSLIGAVYWIALRTPRRTCIYPHCSASRACVHVCPHWRDEHADDANLGI